MSKLINKLIFNKYRLKKLIFASKSSWVYEGYNEKENEPVAVKLEYRKAKMIFLESEAYFLFNLKGFGIPKLISFGKSSLFNILIEELLGFSLHKLIIIKSDKIEDRLKNVCMIALQVLDRLEYIHSRNIIHRDIKPNNLVIGRKDEKTIYLIDFGFARKFRSSRTGKHIKFKNLNYTVGSLRYISRKGNIGYEQSRRDDLESSGYMLVFLATGYLPWLEYDRLNNISLLQKYNIVYKLKCSISPEQLCKGLPIEFINYIKYCRDLEFEQAPNYDYLRSLFTSILTKNNQKNDLNFFWILNKMSLIKKKENNEDQRNKFIRKKGSPQKRLYNKIKASLEGVKDDKHFSSYNKLHLEHVNSLNINSPLLEKYKNYTSLNKSENKNTEIKKPFIYKKKIRNKSFRKSINIRNKMKNKLNDNKIINTNKDTSNQDEKNTLFESITLVNNGNESTEFTFDKNKNKRNILNKNNNKSFVNNKSNNIFKATKRNLIINNLLNLENNEEIFINKEKNNNDFDNYICIGDNYIIKKNNNYRTLFEREREKKINYKIKKNIYFTESNNKYNIIKKNKLMMSSNFDNINYSELRDNNNKNYKLNNIINESYDKNKIHEKIKKNKSSKNIVNNSVFIINKSMQISPSQNNINNINNIKKSLLLSNIVPLNHKIKEINSFSPLYSKGNIYNNNIDHNLYSDNTKQNKILYSFNNGLNGNNNYSTNINTESKPHYNNILISNNKMIETNKLSAIKKYNSSYYKNIFTLKEAKAFSQQNYIKKMERRGVLSGKNEIMNESRK